MQTNDIEFESVQRYDRMQLDSTAELTTEGFLQGNAIVTRTGVFTYQNPDGTLRHELRHPDDVLKMDYLETIKRKPITNDHPKEGLLTPKNVKQYVVGSTGSLVNHDGEFIAVDYVIMDAKAIADVKSGKRELSLGYKCDTIRESGVYNGETYTHRQVNLTNNHLSIVPRARAGSVAKIRLDGALAPIDSEEQVKENGNMENLKTINLDSVDYQAEQQVIDKLKEAEKSANELKVKLDSATESATKVEAERDAAKERLDAVEKELAELKKVHVDSADVQRLVKERVALEGLAKELKVEFKEDSTDAEIRKAIVKHEWPDVSGERLDSDEVYLKARFDVAIEEIARKKKQAEDKSVRGTLGSEHKDGIEIPAAPSLENARKVYNERLTKAHKSTVK